MTHATTPREALLAAAEVIERNGWHQGNYYNPDARPNPADCPVCVLGALLTATMGSPDARPEDNPVYAAAAERLQTQVRRFPFAWNDTPGRTAGEVIAALRAAAALAGEG